MRSAKVIHVFALLCLLSVPCVARAVTIAGEVVPAGEAGVDQLVAYTVYVDAEGDSINALEGTISYDGRLLSYKNAVDGDSIVQVWLKKMTPSSPTQLSFSGLIPGGYAGKGGKLFTLYFVGRAIGNPDIQTEVQAYRNNGNGTLIRVAPLRTLVAIVATSTSPGINPADLIDLNPPRILRATITQNIEVFDGQPFVIVEARDDLSGIRSYELLESAESHTIAALQGTTAGWREVTIPVQLTNLTSPFRYVRVTDRVGNSVIVEVTSSELSPSERVSAFFSFGLIGILILGLAVLTLFVYKKSHE